MLTSKFWATLRAFPLSVLLRRDPLGPLSTLLRRDPIGPLSMLLRRDPISDLATCWTRAGKQPGTKFMLTCQDRRNLSQKLMAQPSSADSVQSSTMTLS